MLLRMKRRALASDHAFPLWCRESKILLSRSFTPISFRLGTSEGSHAQVPKIWVVLETSVPCHSLISALGLELLAVFNSYVLVFLGPAHCVPLSCSACPRSFGLCSLLHEFQVSMHSCIWEVFKSMPNSGTPGSVYQAEHLCF
ncbi:unnamed protein product [Musa banksii]